MNVGDFFAWGCFLGGRFIMLIAIFGCIVFVTGFTLGVVWDHVWLAHRSKRELQRLVQEALNAHLN